MMQNKEPEQYGGNLQLEKAPLINKVSCCTLSKH